LDEDQPSITVRHDRIDNPDPDEQRDQTVETIDELTITPSYDSTGKIEIGTNHGKDRITVSGHTNAPRAYVKHEHHENGNWNAKSRWEIHPAQGIIEIRESQ
jgi:hypothetical protein